MYHNKGSVTLFGQRRNPDLDYIIFYASKNPEDGSGAERGVYAILDFGLKANYFITPHLLINGSFVFEDIHNPVYDSTRYTDNTNRDSVKLYNYIFSLSAKYDF